VGIFVKVLNNFARTEFSYGSRVEFHYAKGEHGVLLMFDYEKKSWTNFTKVSSLG
jgi:hypothetical protein